MAPARKRGPAAALGLAAALALAACAHFGGLRPYYGPIPGSISFLLGAPEDSVIIAAARVVDSAGLQVAVYDPSEGYLETKWYDLGTRRTVGDGARDLDRIVKLRFFGGPVARYSRLWVECVRRIAVDPSEPERSLERMVPDRSPGRVLLDSIAAKLQARYPPPGGAAPAGPAAKP